MSIMSLSKEVMLVRDLPFDDIEINVPSSKSYSNRLLILGALYPGPIRIQNISLSTDVLNLIECLKRIGLEIEEDINQHSEAVVTIHNSFPQCEEDIDDDQDTIRLMGGDGGTTNRFLIALLSRGKRKYSLMAQGKMLIRPIEPLIHTLKNMGVKIESPPTEIFPIEIQGPAKVFQSEVHVDCTLSSQFISALALAFYDYKVKFIPENLKSSQDYYHLTENLIKQFYYEHFRDQMYFEVPVDFSSLAYPVALGLIKGSVTIKNCFIIDMLQADSALLSIIKKMGGDYKLTPKGLQVGRPKRIDETDELFKTHPEFLNAHYVPLKALNEPIDCANFPDLVPVLAFLSSYAVGVTTLKGLDNLDIKESDRVKEICEVLKIFNVPFEFKQNQNCLTISGPAPRVPYQEVNCPKDHRIIMMSYLFLRCNSGGKLGPITPVNKSFPDFFKVMESYANI
jgi:3-phosphoshikimate 1-carboxyvinyltransferase